MVRNVTLFCDVCRQEIPETITMKHKEAADTIWGRFSYHSGVLIHFSWDLCEDCAKKVQDFLQALEQDPQRPGCYGWYGYTKCNLEDCSFHIPCERVEAKAFEKAKQEDKK